MPYEKVIVIGNGKIACECVKMVSNRDIKVEVYESQYSGVSLLQSVSKSAGANFYRLCDRKEIMSHIYKMTENIRTLIISANNEYIIPKEICKLKNVKIVNFHYSYLPDYRGMNIPTWVIWNGEDYTGVSWHFVNENIDDGDIIVQKKIEITETTTAFDIVKSVMSLGCELFNEVLDDLLNDRVICAKPNVGQNLHVYTRKQLPNDGMLDLTQNARMISSILRAFDYGPMQYIPNLKLKTSEGIADVLRYRIWKNEKIILGGKNWASDLIVEKGGFRFDLLLKYIC
jgi:methionyl-tRNA formyltransferase